VNFRDNNRSPFFQKYLPKHKKKTCSSVDELLAISRDEISCIIVDTLRTQCDDDDNGNDDDDDDTKLVVNNIDVVDGFDSLKGTGELLLSDVGDCKIHKKKSHFRKTFTN
jgi:hypothetical protein